MRKILRWSLVIVIPFLFVFTQTKADAAVAPEKDPLCWTKSACTEQYKNAGWCDDKTRPCDKAVNWISDATAKAQCNDWGFCVPPGKSQLSIAFSGKTEVKDLGEYVKLIYNFLVGIAGIIATVLIIKGGVEYITAAGSSEQITSAKSTIGSAVFGLILVLASFMLLNTVNPDLVHLRLPNVYMVRKVVLGADWCQDIAPIKDSNGQFKKFALAKENLNYKDAKFTVEQEKTTCTKNYFFADGDGKTCMGKVCNDRPTCKQYSGSVSEEDKAKQKPCICQPKTNGGKDYDCFAAQFGGAINWAGTRYVKEAGLAVICKDKILFSGGAPELGESKHEYSVSISSGKDSCDSFLGYLLNVNINNPTGFTKSSDSWFAGKSFCKNLCSVGGIYHKDTSVFDDPFVETTKGKEALQKIISAKDYWTDDDLAKGVTCDLNISGSLPILTSNNTVDGIYINNEYVSCSSAK